MLRPIRLKANIIIFILLLLFSVVLPAHSEIWRKGREGYLIEQGLKHYRAEEYELALENFLKALELNPDSKSALKYVNMARDEISKVKEQELFHQAVKDYEDHNYELAIDKLVQVLALNPRNRDAIDYIQKIKKEVIATPEVEAEIVEKEELPAEAITERIEEETRPPEEPEAEAVRKEEERAEEKVVSPDLTKIAKDIEIIKREVAKSRLGKPEKLVEEVPKKSRRPMSMRLVLSLLSSLIFASAVFAYWRKASKKRKLSERSLKLMENLSKTAMDGRHREEIFEDILDAFMQVAQAQAGALFTIEHKTGDLVLVAGIEVGPTIIPGEFRFNKDSSIFAEISEITNPTLASEILEGDTYENLLLFEEKPVSPFSLVIVPLVYKTRKVGVALVSSKRMTRKYFREYSRLLQTLAGQAAIIIANIAYDRQVIVDGLTGLYVHWFFYQCLEKEISRAERQNSSLALLMVDLDHFKQFNDTYGHPTGDRALVKIAEILKNDLRDIDTVARYGGEEFAIILPGVDEKLAFKTAERIRKGVENYRFKVVNGKFRLTLSIGISTHEKGLNAKGMVERADKSLYWVKEHGRNQVKSWTSISTTDQA